MKTLAERFWSKVQIGANDECWPFTSVDVRGYGQIQAGKRGVGVLKAHRVSYELHNGPVPDGLHVLHSCDNPSCVNPSHLHLGTHQDNMREMAARRRAGQRRLNEEQVVEIRDLRSRGVSQREVARLFGVTKNAISNIDHGRSHSYV